MEEAARVIMKAFTNCVTDRCVVCSASAKPCAEGQVQTITICRIPQMGSVLRRIPDSEMLLPCMSVPLSRTLHRPPHKRGSLDQKNFASEEYPSGYRRQS